MSEPPPTLSPPGTRISRASERCTSIRRLVRFKIIDARTTQQVAQGYAEDKLEVGSTGTSVFGVSSRQAGGTTLDALVVKLVQKNVADIDQKYK